MPKITELDELLTAPDASDKIAIVDVDDTTQSPDGTTKGITVSLFLSSVDLTGFVPYTGATAALNLGINDFIIGGNIFGVNAGGPDVSGGALQLIAGGGDGTGHGGQLVINGGNGGATNALGGAVVITAGASGGDSDGADVILAPSDFTGAGANHGHVKFGVPQNGAAYAAWDTSALTDTRLYALPDTAGMIALTSPGVSGSFLSADAKTVTVVDGIITSIA